MRNRFTLVLIREVLLLLVAALVVLSLPFCLGKLAFGDISVLFVGFNAPESIRAVWLRGHGLEGPWLKQYLSYIGLMVGGKLGHSYTYQVPVIDLIADRWRPTFQMALLGTAAGLVAGYLLSLLLYTLEGIRYRPGKWASRVLVIGFIPVPVVLYMFRDILISSGWSNSAAQSGSASSIILGAAALAILPMTFTIATIWPAIKEELWSYHALAARIAGIGKVEYLWHFGSRLFLLRGMALTRPALMYCLSFSFFPETIFGIEGLGVLSVDAALKGDLPLLSACALIPLSVLMLAARIIRLFERMLDPRQEAL